VDKRGKKSKKKEKRGKKRKKEENRGKKRKTGEDHPILTSHRPTLPRN